MTHLQWRLPLDDFRTLTVDSQGTPPTLFIEDVEQPGSIPLRRIHSEAEPLNLVRAIQE